MQLRLGFKQVKIHKEEALLQLVMQQDNFHKEQEQLRLDIQQVKIHKVQMLLQLVIKQDKFHKEQGQ